MMNKRQYARVTFNKPVSYQRGENSASEGSLAEDISQTGLKLCINEFIPLNTVLELKVQLPGQTELIPAHAKVVWIKEVACRDDAWEIGLQLVSSEEFTHAIQGYINRKRFENLN